MSDKYDYSDYLNWKNDPITQIILGRLLELRKHYEDCLLNCHTNDIALIAKYIGKCNVLDEINNLSYEDFLRKDSE